MSDLPDALVQAISDADSQLRRDGLGDLWLGWRRHIYRAIGTQLDFETGEGDHRAHAVRAELARASVRQALPVWEQALPGNPLAEGMLAIARNYSRSGADKDQVEELAHGLWITTGRIYASQEELQIPAMVAYAAAQAAYVALWDEGFDHDDRKTVTDADVELDEIGAAGLAAIAISGGMVQDEASDVAKRRAFWRWWLHEAIADAWAEIP